MRLRSKRILTDETGQPVEVLIAYAEWQTLEKAIEQLESPDNSAAIMSFAGSLDWNEDALEFQKRLRADWE